MKKKLAMGDTVYEVALLLKELKSVETRTATKATKCIINDSKGIGDCIKINKDVHTFQMMNHFDLQKKIER